MHLLISLQEAAFIPGSSRFNEELLVSGDENRLRSTVAEPALELTFMSVTRIFTSPECKVTLARMRPQDV